MKRRTPHRTRVYVRFDPQERLWDKQFFPRQVLNLGLLALESNAPPTSSTPTLCVNKMFETKPILCLRFFVTEDSSND